MHEANKVCENFGENFKYHRQRLGISHKQLSEACGFSESIQAKWERGECIPGLYCLIAMANYMGITVDELIGRERGDADG